MKTRDIDIRSVLMTKLSREHSNEEDVLILDELGVCQGEARIDVAVINGAMNGYEIKSESDTLERLPRQTEAYNRVFDTVTLVVSEKYIEDVREKIPPWWGILRVKANARGNIILYRERRANKNKMIDPYAIAQLLWRDEAIELLKKRGLHKGLMSKPREYIWKALAENVPKKELQYEVRCVLKSRKSWRVH
ncbi:sce7726 family protein [Paenibacillus sp. NPDC057967]|uniref:sce7726 family protein n=1 Tax=Paenibacillus sp. NPDC057967 TaxID=3346293 RepID=UPI0036DC4C6A